MVFMSMEHVNNQHSLHICDIMESQVSLYGGFRLIVLYKMTEIVNI